MMEKMTSVQVTTGLRGSGRRKDGEAVDRRSNGEWTSILVLNFFPLSIISPVVHYKLFQAYRNIKRMVFYVDTTTTHGRLLGGFRSRHGNGSCLGQPFLSCLPWLSFLQRKVALLCIVICNALLPLKTA